MRTDSHDANSPTKFSADAHFLCRGLIVIPAKARNSRNLRPRTKGRILYQRGNYIIWNTRTLHPRTRRFCYDRVLIERAAFPDRNVLLHIIVSAAVNAVVPNTVDVSTALSYSILLFPCGGLLFPSISIFYQQTIFVICVSVALFTHTHAMSFVINNS